MMNKTWNVRDQTKKALEELLTRKYKEIDSEYKMLRKVTSIQDAKKLLDEIWQMKSFANTIEMELIRREYNDGATS
jgi:adenine C2-methylase RlmN of 23S rRNA A2503 and tRNA A37